jgi:hypothetical protein
MTTVARPLSAGNIVMSGIFRSSARALASSLVRLGGCGLGFLSIWFMVLRRSVVAAVLVPMSRAASSVAVMKSTIGICLGVGRKARPFLRTSIWGWVRGTDDWLYNHRSLGLAVGGGGGVLGWVGGGV